MGLMKTKEIGNSLLGNMSSGVPLFDLSGLIGSDFGAAVLFSLSGEAPSRRVVLQNSGPVEMILRARDPLKVLNAVVGLVSVLVVALKSIWTVTHERFKNKDVNPKVSLPTIGTHKNRLAVAGLLQASDVPTHGGSLRAPRNADVSEVRHFVSPLEAINYSPLFAHDASATSLRKGGEVAATGAEIRLFGLQSLAA